MVEGIFFDEFLSILDERNNKQIKCLHTALTLYKSAS